MNNSSETIGNPTRDLPACRAVLKLTEPLRTADIYVYLFHGCWINEKRLFERQVSPLDVTDTYAVRF
jgi:hypothetical protein